MFINAFRNAIRNAILVIPPWIVFLVLLLVIYFLEGMQELVIASPAMLVFSWLLSVCRWEMGHYAEDNVMRLAELHAHYQKNLTRILSKVQLRDSDSHLTSDPSQSEFVEIEDIRKLLGSVKYQLFEIKVLNLDTIVKRTAMSVRSYNLFEECIRSAKSAIREIQEKFKAPEEEQDLLSAIETAMDPEKEYLKTYGQSIRGWKPSSKENGQDEGFYPKHIRDKVAWSLNDTKTTKLFSDLERSIKTLIEIADTIEPKQEISLDFTKETIVKCWRLDPKESGTSNTLSNLSSNDALPRSRIFESLLGGYQRDQVPLNEIQPGGQYRGICKLQIRLESKFGEYGQSGSGWLLNSRTVVTAAHCVYSVDKKGSDIFAVEVDVSIGQHTQIDTPINTEKEHRQGASVAIHWGYYVLRKTQDDITQYDIAIIKLDRPFDKASEIAWQNCPLCVNKPTVRVVGYPGDLPAHQLKKGHDMYVSECQLSDYSLDSTNFELRYTLDTKGGNSGGPILEVASDRTSFKAIGVHCRGGTYWNSGSALGHVGNHLWAFQDALAQISGRGYIVDAKGDNNNTHKIPVPLLASQVPMKSDMHTEGRKA